MDEARVGQQGTLTRVWAKCSATALMAGPRQQDGRSLRGATMA